MKSFPLLTSLLFVLPLIVHAQSVSLNLAVALGGEEWEEGWAVATDHENNLICGGYFEGEFDADPGTGMAMLNSNGQEDAFIAKLNAEGEFQWAVEFGNSLDDACTALVTDELGNVYMAGYFLGEIDFDHGPGEFVLSSATSGLLTSALIMKYDPEGNFLWAIALQGASHSSALGINYVEGGILHVTGHFGGTIEFSQNGGIQTYSSASPNYPDVFILRMNSDGEILDSTVFGGNGYDFSNDICSDANGNVIVTGQFGSTAQFDPFGEGFELVSNGTRDAYVAKYDDNLDFLWAIQFSGPGIDEAFAIDVDQIGNVVLTGYFRDLTDFDPSPDEEWWMEPSMGNLERQTFVAKLDPFGNLIWARSLGTSPSQEGHGIAIDSGNNVYTTGHGTGGDFDPGPGTYNLPDDEFGISANGMAYISKLDEDGNFIAAYAIEGPWSIFGYDIALTQNESIVVTGYFRGPADFDPGSGTFELSSVDNRDVFLVVLDQDQSNHVQHFAKPEFTIYPNPMTHSSILQLYEPCVDCRMELLDASGKVVRQSSISSQDFITLSRNQLQSGVYLLRIIEPNGMYYTRSLVVANGD